MFYAVLSNEGMTVDFESIALAMPLKQPASDIELQLAAWSPDSRDKTLPSQRV